jgi:hypothetical protein
MGNAFQTPGKQGRAWHHTGRHGLELLLADMEGKLLLPGQAQELN